MPRVLEIVRQSDGVLFKAGMKVRGWDRGATHRGTFPNAPSIEGTIHHVDTYLNLENHHTVSILLTAPNEHGSVGDNHTLWFDTMELAALPLDLARPIQLRSGKPVEILKQPGPNDRPIRAMVEVAGKRNLRRLWVVLPGPRATHRSGAGMILNWEGRLNLKKGTAYDWSRLPRKGELVEDLGSAVRKGRRGKIVSVRPHNSPQDDQLLTIQWDDRAGPTSEYYIWRFRPVCVEIDAANLSNVTRGGHKVHTADLRGDCIQALVEVQSTNLVLRYELDGRLYPGMDSPIDLVQNV